MGRKRIHDKGLPERWRFRSGAYYYRVPPGLEYMWDGKTEFLLGRTLAEAHQRFGLKLNPIGEGSLLKHVIARYRHEVMPTKAPATIRVQNYSLERIELAMGHIPVAAIQPKHLYAYRDQIAREESKKKANLDLEVLSHMFTKSIEWGVINVHPMTGKKVVKFSLKARDRYVTDEELASFASILPRKWQIYVELKVRTGRRKAELLRLKTSDLLPEGMAFTDAKDKGKKFILAWTERTRTLIAELLNDPKRPPNSEYVFSTRDGDPYINEADGTTSGFDSIWQRNMKKALDEGKIKERFTEHDLRAKRASDLTLEKATELLQHSNSRTTQRVYRRKVDVITME